MDDKDTDSKQQWIPRARWPTSRLHWCVRLYSYFVLNAAFRACSFSDNCPLGDRPGVVHEGTNCTALIKDFSGYCYQDFFQLTCCSACAAVYRPVQSKFSFFCVHFLNIFMFTNCSVCMFVCLMKRKFLKGSHIVLSRLIKKDVHF